MNSFFFLPKFQIFKINKFFRIDQAVVRKHVDRMLECLANNFTDTSWTVRSEACSG